jgi:hypothetical protein
LTSPGEKLSSYVSMIHCGVLDAVGTLGPLA